MSYHGRQVSFSGHPSKKTIHSYNVEGNERHPYKEKFLNRDNVKYFIKEKMKLKV